MEVLILYERIKYHRRQQSTLEQDNDAPQMPICLMNLNEPKQR
jgi:hypothetical protein